jgi:hypothetical protein
MASTVLLPPKESQMGPLGRRLRLALATLLTMLLLAACGGGGVEDEGPPLGSDREETETAAGTSDTSETES